MLDRAFRKKRSAASEQPQCHQHACDKLDHSGSALINQPGYHVGIQSWYNQALIVNPSNRNQVYVIGARSLVEGKKPITDPKQLSGLTALPLIRCR